MIAGVSARIDSASSGRLLTSLTPVFATMRVVRDAAR